MQLIQPLLNQPTGPGFEVRPLTDFVGPIALGSTWEVNLFPETEEQAVSVARLFSQLPNPSIVLGRYQDGVNTVKIRIPTQLSSTPHGATARLQVTLIDPVGQILDTGTFPVKYDAVTGTQYIASVLPTSTIQGGYTESDRSVAAQTLTAARAIFPSGIAGIADAVMDIGQLFTNPPVEILRRDTFLDLVGRGQLVYPDGTTQVSAYGAFIELIGAPSGAGFRDGVVTEYEVRIAQFSVRGRHGNTQSYVKFLYDLNWGGQYLIWGAPFPRRIDYDITPRFTVRWRWLVLGIQP